MSAPPTYLAGPAPASALDLSQSLPSYSRTDNIEWDVPSSTQEHNFHLTKKTGEQWLALTVISRASSSTETPMFFQGGKVAGSLRLQLDEDELVDNVAISLYGRINIFSHSTSDFLYMSRVLFSAAEQDPESSPVTFKRGRLRGQYDWPFSFRLPKTVSIPLSFTDGGETERQSYRLPPSFTGTPSDAHVQYLLVVRVNRSGLRSTSKLTAPFRYVPLARPSPPTIMRQLAYQQNTALLGPEDDPDSWKTFESVKIRGILFKTVVVEALCKLSVSRPFTYTAGAPIHLLITIESSNNQFLDLITPESIHCSLVQHITFGNEMSKIQSSQRLNAQITVRSHSRATTSWWRLPASNSPPPTKVFAGEALVPSDLAPACRILHYGHHYELALYPLTAVAFKSDASPKKALLSQPITIVTAFAQGPRPRSYAPPEYNAN